MTVVLFTAAAAMMALYALMRMRASAATDRVPITTHSPREHAEAILAHRYATGHLSAQEYTRSLAVLRR